MSLLIAACSSVESSISLTNLDRMSPIPGPPITLVISELEPPLSLSLDLVLGSHLMGNMYVNWEDPARAWKAETRELAAVPPEMTATDTDLLSNDISPS